MVRSTDLSSSSRNLVLCITLVLGAAAGLSTLGAPASAAPQTQVFSFVAPAGVPCPGFTFAADVCELEVVLVGGSGGAGRNFSGEIDHAGGLGGTATANLEVNPGEVSEIRVGGGVSFGVGGFNGGGSAATTFGGGGGGPSDIRQGGSDLADRVVVAGGGGGGRRLYPTPRRNPGSGRGRWRRGITG